MMVAATLVHGPVRGAVVAPIASRTTAMAAPVGHRQAGIATLVADSPSLPLRAVGARPAADDDVGAGLGGRSAAAGVAGRVADALGGTLAPTTAGVGLMANGGETAVPMIHVTFGLRAAPGNGPGGPPSGGPPANASPPNGPPAKASPAGGPPTKPADAPGNGPPGAPSGQPSPPAGPAGGAAETPPSAAGAPPGRAVAAHETPPGRGLGPPDARPAAEPPSTPAPEVIPSALPSVLAPSDPGLTNATHPQSATFPATASATRASAATPAPSVDQTGTTDTTVPAATTPPAPTVVAEPVIVEPVGSAPATAALDQPLPVELARVVRDVAEPFAFPIALALVVGAFLIVQGRIDRRDPKLADRADDDLHFG
jgi:hypothetical protein